MANQKVSTFIMSVIALILVVTLFKQFDFENLRFEKMGMAVVYSIALVIAIYLLVKGLKNNNSSKH
jgi:uncharacterized membrane protein